MTATSPGSQPNPQQFLTAYAQQVEDHIKDLQAMRMPPEGDYALKGAEGQTIKDKVVAGAIQIPGMA